MKKTICALVLSLVGSLAVGCSKGIEPDYTKSPDYFKGRISSLNVEYIPRGFVGDVLITTEDDGSVVKYGFYDGGTCCNSVCVSGNDMSEICYEAEKRSYDHSEALFEGASYAAGLIKEEVLNVKRAQLPKIVPPQFDVKGE
ncbi:MAG: hypothetical protein WCV90_02580 [Candidatus Woesearchaeota archaeon]|jgi:hypothetical protein